MTNRTIVVLWLVLVTLSPAGEAFAQDVIFESEWFTSARTDLRTFPERLERDAKTTFLDRGNATALLCAGLASVAMNKGPADEDIADYFERYDTVDGLDAEALGIIGSPAAHFPAAVVWYAISAERHDEASKERALTMFTALTINGAVTVALKAVRQNDRPGGEGWAWPSGHTSSSFTVASVLHEFYGLKVGIPAYAGASLVAYRMMDVGDHWASDVVFGATLGLVVGHTVARNHGMPEVAGFEILPYYGNPETPAIGISLARQF